MGLSLVTPPTDYPVTLEEARAQCRVLHTDEDALIQTYIIAATSYVERQLSLSLMTRTYALTLDAFTDTIELPRGPVASVTSVGYVDQDGLPATVDSDLYTVDLSSTPQWVVLNSGSPWPTPMSGINMVTVTYVAGADELPESMGDIKAAILLMVAHFYANREAASVNEVKEVPLAVDALLMGWRWVLV
jgi:uncharacterized phiE125 gp8 family phage protein